MLQNNHDGTWFCMECDVTFTDEQMGNGEAEEHKCDESIKSLINNNEASN